MQSSGCAVWGTDSEFALGRGLHKILLLKYVWAIFLVHLGQNLLVLFFSRHNLRKSALRSDFVPLMELKESGITTIIYLRSLA